MNKTFEQEWSLYKAGGRRPKFTGEAPRGEAEFDSPVKVGEIRIFADMARPFVALVAEDRGAAGCFIVPVSPFTVPASSREMLEGERVYQLWNACTASRRFVERSWLVETLDADSLAAVRGRCAARVGLAAEGAVAEYEREFLVSGGDFIPLVNKAAPRIVVVNWRRVCGVAACFAILLGLSVSVFEIKKELSAIEESKPKAAVLEEYEEEVCACAPCEEIASEPPAVQDGLALVKSPITMESMCGMRSSGSIGAATCGGARGRRRALASNTPWHDRDSVGTERYAEFHEDEYRDPRNEPLSTFGLDVDTSSYATMRRYITEMRRLPPKESVRLEEYVNYFKYRYPQPKGDEPIAVACEMGACPWASSHKLLRVGVQAREVPAEKLPPCNLTFLIDVSGSMGSNGGFEMMKAGLKMLIGKLRPEDHVAIVTYASGTRLRLGSTPGSEKATIRSVVDGLSCGGCTYGAGGIQLAYEEAKKNFDKKANNRVVLVTDGDFNVGISSPKALEEFIASKRESGVFLSIIGVGRGNYQDAIMKKLSTAGNGNYAYLDTLLEAKKVMLNEFSGTLFTVAKDVKLQLEFNPAEVRGYRLLGYESRRLAAKDFNDDRKDAGEIGSGHTMTALYEIIPADSKEKVSDVDPLKYQKRTESGRGEVCTVKLRWKKPDGDTSELKEIPVAECEVTPKTSTEDFRFATAVAEYALLISGSKFKGEASFDAVLDRARKAKGEDTEGYRAEFIRLVEMAELFTPPPSLLAPAAPKKPTQPWDASDGIEVDL